MKSINRPREIKFRFWNKKTSAFITTVRKETDTEEDYVMSLDGNLHGVSIGDGQCFVLNRNDFVIQQFTGLKDSKGKEIYEGDIIECNKSSMLGVDRITEVKQDLETGGYYPFCLKENGEYYCGEHDSENIKVIGNIFENSNLLCKCGDAHCPDCTTFDASKLR